MINQDELEQDMAVFADLGTHAPDTSRTQRGFRVRMFRNGKELELDLSSEAPGGVIERDVETDRRRVHASYRALLASESFGNLRQWAHAQQNTLEVDPSDTLDVRGELSESQDSVDVVGLDRFLVQPHSCPGSVRLVLIDGPAGIGKTHFIQTLAARRARGHFTTQHPLILHVESRGRVLTFIQDLIAYSLQRMRLPVTFDQVPILVRHDLVTLAIDGFDELGDPSGYEHAWGQMNEIIESIHGQGTIILAGRDTFVGHDRIRNGIRSLRDSDAVTSLSIRPPEPEVARNWLHARGWSDDDIESIDDLLEPDSYALRPFFLTALSDPQIAAPIKDLPFSTLLPLLVDLMVKREASKFGDAVEEAMDEEARCGFIRTFLRETARFMADDETEAINEIALGWIVDLAVPEGTPEETTRLLKNRAEVMAFLAPDSARNHRRFSHSQILNHFLSDATFRAVLDKETPKFLRRNILASDFLGVFVDLMPQETAERSLDFVDAALDILDGYSGIDRGPRNIGAMLLAILTSLTDPNGRGSGSSAKRLRLGELQVDETMIKGGTAFDADIVHTTISQLDARGADLRPLKFHDSSVVTLVASSTTRLPKSFPTPTVLQLDERGRQKTITAPGEIEQRMTTMKGELAGTDGRVEEGLIPSRLANRPLVWLLERACRSRPYWIRGDGSDPLSARLVKDDHWPILVGVLRKHDLLRSERKQAGGRATDFLHIRRKMAILEQADDEAMRAFYASVVDAIDAETQSA